MALTCTPALGEKPEVGRRVEEAFSPATDDLASRAETVGDLIIGEALVSEEDHLALLTTGFWSFRWPFRLIKGCSESVPYWTPRRAFCPLLADLESRGKRTFTSPFARWLPRDPRATLDRVFAPEQLRATDVLEPPVVLALWERYQHSSNSVGWSRIWSLSVLQRWCETMQVTA